MRKQQFPPGLAAERREDAGRQQHRAHGKGLLWEGAEEGLAHNALCQPRAVLLREGSSGPTINPADQLFQRLDLLLDPWLCEGVVILPMTQSLG